MILGSSIYTIYYTVLNCYPLSTHPKGWVDVWGLNKVHCFQSFSQLELLKHCLPITDGISNG
ncbi:MAG TPA: hypothetical protein PLL79_04370, partial [Candidatus Cloacimonas acidaminovorans]|nr:hypothetical protein [Candidatus Cloacimonas acidaminovorans]